MRGGAFILLPVILLPALILIVSGCEARKTHEELVEFGGEVESSRPQKEKIENDFDALRQHKVETQEDFNKLGLKIAQLVIDIEEMIRPVEEMELETEEARKLRREYLDVWTSFRDALRLTLRAMATPDKRQSAQFMERVMQKNRDYQAALQKFSTDYSTIMNRYGIKKEDLETEPRAVPVSPAPYTEAMPMPGQPGIAGVK